MKTIKIILNADGSPRDIGQNININQYSFQDTLLNVYVPTSISNFGITSKTEVIDEITHTYTYSTNVLVGLTYTKPNGNVYVGNGYLFNFVKKLIIENVEYALFERLLPKEFALYSGEQTMSVNVVNVTSDTIDDDDSSTATETTTTITSVITSGNFTFEVLRSTSFTAETDETTDVERLQATVNGLIEEFDLKQDKEDSTINVYTDSTHSETTQNVVEALNDLNARVGTNESDLTTLKPQVQTNTEDIAELKNQIICDAIYVGSITANTSPDSTTLTNFVISQGYTLKNGDVVIWIEQISGATDKTYKCMYGASGWGWYEIPPIESASNGTKGIIAGTYGIDNYNTLVNIVDGKVIGIYCKKADNTYEEITTLTQNLQTAITNIINGTLSIGSADFATYDSSEKENAVKTTINDKFTTPSQVNNAIQNYAMPKVFNEVFFFDFENNTMVDEVEETTALTIDLSTIGNKTSTFTQAVSIPHKLNKSNTFQVQLLVYAANLVNDTNASFTLRLIDENNNETVLGTSLATIKANTDMQLVNFTGYTFGIHGEVEVSTDCHYELDINILNEYSNNGNITLDSGVSDSLSTYILSLPFGSFELSEAKKGEVFNINATCYYTIEKVLYLGISTGEFDPSNYTSTESVATHIKATYISPLYELDADATIKAIINGVEYTIYSPQCNNMLYGYFKPVQISKILSNSTYTYTFEFDAIFNSINGFYIDIPFSTIVRLTQTEYNALSSASLLNDKLLYSIEVGTNQQVVDTESSQIINGQKVFANLGTDEINNSTFTNSLTFTALEKATTDCTITDAEWTDLREGL